MPSAGRHSRNRIQLPIAIAPALEPARTAPCSSPPRIAARRADSRSVSSRWVGLPPVRYTTSADFGLGREIGIFGVRPVQYHERPSVRSQGLEIRLTPLSAARAWGSRRPRQSGRSSTDRAGLARLLENGLVHGLTAAPEFVTADPAPIYLTSTTPPGPLVPPILPLHPPDMESTAHPVESGLGDSIPNSLLADV